MHKKTNRKLTRSILLLFICTCFISCKPKEAVPQQVELPSDAFNKETLVSLNDADGKETDSAEKESQETVKDNSEDANNSPENGSDASGATGDTPGITVINDNENQDSEKTGDEKPSEQNSTPGTLTPEEEAAKQSFYQEELSQERRNAMIGVSYPAEGSTQLSLDDLRYLHILHYDFEGNVKEGELICNKSVSDDMLDIFYQLYLAKYPITSVKLIDEFGGDDGLSMAANNTSAFNYRVVSGTDRLSKHALGVAIDINPQINPYVVIKNGEITRVSPENGTDYADRTRDFPGKIDKNDLCYKLFHEKGFFWGGDWKTTKDYQHFQKTD